jgi:hypothetical protein
VSKEERVGIRKNVPYIIPIKPKTPIYEVERLRKKWPKNISKYAAVTHLIIKKFILKPAGICGLCVVNVCT